MYNDHVAYEMMGPAFLASQEIDPKDKLKFFKESDWEDIYAHLESSISSMRNWRYSWWSHWCRLAEYFKPRRIHWLPTPNRMSRGSEINDAIIDGSPTIAVNICSSGMWSGLTNPARPWFKIDPRSPGVTLDAEGQQWIDDLVEATFGVLENSNFYEIMAQAFEDLVVFGTAPIIVYEDEQQVIRLYLPCAGEYYLKLGARMSIDTLGRDFLMNVQQLVEMFTYEECPQQIQLAFKEGGSRLAEEYVVGHIIEPNFAIQRKAPQTGRADVTPGSFVYRELYWLLGKEMSGPLSRRGFNDAPFFTLLWSRGANDPYGRSACMDALGDNKELQRGTMRAAEFVDKLVRPPMGADISLQNEPKSIMAGMTSFVNTANGKPQFFPLFEVQPAALTPLTTRLDSVSKRIDKALFVDVFLAITQMQGVEPRNELELTKRDLERLQRLGPVINLVSTALGTALIRIMSIIERKQGMLKPMPASLRATKFKMTFESIARLAQRSAETVAMRDTFATMGGLSSAAKAAGVPDPIRVFNLDKAAKKYATSNNFPTDCIFTDQQVEEHDRARLQQKAAAVAPQMAMAGVQAAKTLSQTQVPGGSALGALMGQTGI